MTRKTQKKMHKKIWAEGTGTQQVSPVKMEAELGSWEHLVRHVLSSETRTSGQYGSSVADREEILI